MEIQKNKSITRELDSSLARIIGLLEVELCALDLVHVAELEPELPKPGDSKLILRKIKMIQWKMQDVINKFKELEGEV